MALGSLCCAQAPDLCFRFLLAHAKDGNEVARGGGSAECLILDILSPGTHLQGGSHSTPP